MRFWFVLSEIAAGFRRNLTMISAVILVTFVSLASVGAALLLQMQIDKLQGEWYGKVEVSVWLCPAEYMRDDVCPDGPVTPDQQAAIEARLTSEELTPYVADYTLQPPEEVFKEFQDSFGEDWWTSGLTVDAFPVVIHVKLAHPDDYQVVEEAVTGQPGVYRVLDQSELLSPLFDILEKAQIAALVIAGVLMVAAILLIATTIRLSAMSRQKETGIMRLVGASNLFIQLPFMLEGAVAALIGSMLAVAALWLVGKFWLAGWLAASFGTLMSRINTADIFVVAPWLMVMAVVLAALSSVLTLRRFTKV
jgi:cell division transport system permease protein